LKHAVRIIQLTNIREEISNAKTLIAICFHSLAEMQLSWTFSWKPKQKCRDEKQNILAYSRHPKYVATKDRTIL